MKDITICAIQGITICGVIYLLVSILPGCVEGERKERMHSDCLNRGATFEQCKELLK